MIIITSKIVDRKIFGSEALMLAWKISLTSPKVQRFGINFSRRDKTLFHYSSKPPSVFCALLSIQEQTDRIVFQHPSPTPFLVNRPFPHSTSVRTNNSTRARLGWTFSYICCIFVPPNLDSVPLFVGMQERSKCHKTERVCH